MESVPRHGRSRSRSRAGAERLCLFLHRKRSVSSKPAPTGGEQCVAGDRCRPFSSCSAHLLLAQVYEAKHDPASEAAQLRAYLKVAPNSPYSASVRKSLLQLEGQIPK